jgi:hypothetical protein
MRKAFFGGSNFLGHLQIDVNIHISELNLVYSRQKVANRVARDSLYPMYYAFRITLVPFSFQSTALAVKLLKKIYLSI